MAPFLLLVTTDSCMEQLEMIRSTENNVLDQVREQARQIYEVFLGRVRSVDEDPEVSGCERQDSTDPIENSKWTLVLNRRRQKQKGA